VAQYEIVRPGGGPHYEWGQDAISVKVSSRHADGRVTMVEDALKPGFRLARHVHKVMTEIFYLLEGHVRFVFDEETVVATPAATTLSSRRPSRSRRLSAGV
jgi:quercetin dioxygenase-like cupin family protein